MKTSKKWAVAFALVLFLLACFSYAPPAEAKTGEFVIDSTYVSNTGYCEVIGHYEGAELNTQMSCVVALEGLFGGETVIEKNFNTDYVAYIDQIGTGNNGTFLLQFSVPMKFSKKELVVVLTSENGDRARTVIEIPFLPFDINSVENNSVIYGKDVYYVPGIFYTPDLIAESIVYGGNNIYFKIGGLWYDLMDEKATDNSFLTKENATPMEKIHKLGIRYYFGMTKRV